MFLYKKVCFKFWCTLVLTGWTLKPEWWPCRIISLFNSFSSDTQSLCLNYKTPFSSSINLKHPVFTPLKIFPNDGSLVSAALIWSIKVGEILKWDKTSVCPCKITSLFIFFKLSSRWPWVVIKQAKQPDDFF